MSFDEDKKDSKLFALNFNKELLIGIVKNAVREVMAELKEPAHQEDEWLTTKQVCDLLHVSKGTIVNWRNSGKLEFHKAGNRILFQREQVLAIITKIKVYKSEGDLVL